MVVELVVDLVAFETGPQRGRDCASDAEAVVTSVEKGVEGETGVLVDGFVGGRVDEVPR